MVIILLHCQSAVIVSGPKPLLGQKTHQTFYTNRLKKNCIQKPLGKINEISNLFRQA